jgi:predicted permease
METLLQDLRYSFRVLRKSPSFAAIAVLTLALGIGANSTIFSWINSTLLNPIPGVRHTSDFVVMTEGGTARSPIPFSYLDYMDLRNRTRSFSGLIAYDINPMNLTGTGKPERVWGTLASANYFDVLGIHPILGRGFLPVEDQKPGGAPVVVISYRLWQIRFGGDPSVIGRTLRIDQHPFTIIGVAPAVFQGTQTGMRTELWVPLMMQQQIVSGTDRLPLRSETWLMLLGQLAPGVTRGQAQAEMDLLMNQIVEQFPDSHLGNNAVTLYPLWRAPFSANTYMYVLLPVLMAIAGVVLLLACANVANLMLVRSVSRRREIAIRLSIGASRWRLVRQLLIESVVLSSAGGILAMFITAWTTGMLGQFIPPTNIPIALDFQVDRAVFFVTFAISILSGVIFGILPALRASDMAPVTVLKEDAGSAAGGLHRARLSSALVVTQISLSLFLLVSAGLFIRSFRQAQRFNAGFNPDHVLLASYSLFPAGYTEARGLEFHRQLLAKARNIAGRAIGSPGQLGAAGVCIRLVAGLSRGICAAAARINGNRRGHGGAELSADDADSVDCRTRVYGERHGHIAAGRDRQSEVRGSVLAAPGAVGQADIRIRRVVHGGRYRAQFQLLFLERSPATVSVSSDFSGLLLNDNHPRAGFGRPAGLHGGGGKGDS